MLRRSIWIRYWTMWIIAPRENNSWLFEVRENDLLPIADLLIPPADRWIQIDGCVAAVARSHPSVFLVEPKNDLVRVGVLRLPATMRPNSIASWGDWIFVAGDQLSSSRDTVNSYVLDSETSQRRPALLAGRRDGL